MCNEGGECPLKDRCFGAKDKKLQKLKDPASARNYY